MHRKSPEEKENTTDEGAKWSSKGEPVKGSTLKQSDEVVKLGSPILSPKDVLGSHKDVLGSQKDVLVSHKDVLGSPLQCTRSPHNSPIWKPDFSDSTPGTSVSILSNNLQTIFKKKKKTVKVSMQKDSKAPQTKMKCRKKLKSLKRQTTI